jgi:hypothetical protein
MISRITIPAKSLHEQQRLLKRAAKLTEDAVFDNQVFNDKIYVRILNDTVVITSSFYSEYVLLKIFT